MRMDNMNATGKIRELPVRRVGQWNPEWVNGALRSSVVAKTQGNCGQTAFGRNWSLMGEIRDKCLAQLASAHRPVRVLDVGIGDEPYPEAYELRHLFTKASVDHHISVMDIRREALLGLMRQRRLKISPAKLSHYEVPPTYYETFLGRTFVREGSRLGMNIPKSAWKGIRFYHGDIATGQLPGRQFDLIVCLNVFMYLNNKLSELAMFNLAQSLRRGGILITEGLTEKGVKSYESLGANFMPWFSSSRLAELGFKVLHGPLSNNFIDMTPIQYYHVFALQRI